MNLNQQTLTANNRSYFNKLSKCAVSTTLNKASPCLGQRKFSY